METGLLVRSTAIEPCHRARTEIVASGEGGVERRPDVDVGLGDRNGVQ